MVSRSKEKDILYCTFNQDQSCVSVGTPNGFKIFATSPLKETFSRDLKGGIGIVEMLYRCNILALVGGGDAPKFPATKVMIWDDHQAKCIAELSFKTDVKQVKLKADKIVVATENTVYVYHFSDMKPIGMIETCANEDGIFALNNDPKGTVLATPAKIAGHVSLHPYGTGTSITFRAHKTQISCMELDFTGRKLATASGKGTIIRVFNTDDGNLIHELRRGTDNAFIYSIAFDVDSKWLACSSDSTTVHIFSLQSVKKGDQALVEDNSEKAAKNPKSKLSFMKKLNPYFGSEWSLAQYKAQDKKTKVAFAPESNQLHIAGYDGNFVTVSFDPVNGGECVKQCEGKIL